MTARLAASVFRSAILILSFALAGNSALAEVPHAVEHDQVVKLLRSIENNQYDVFLENGSEYFRSRISKQHFSNVSERLAQQLKNGFYVSFLTEFKQAGLVGTLWKVEYKDGSDDALAKIFMEDGKIVGFWFQ